ncbi:hypothetical protein EDC01DRAFT_781478 [Geopyxis carbonaria]|nr:hypothetical protein EDC01DRAFT_781478 [Geopyxis carbonaria]
MSSSSNSTMRELFAEARSKDEILKEQLKAAGFEPREQKLNEEEPTWKEKYESAQKELSAMHTLWQDLYAKYENLKIDFTTKMTIHDFPDRMERRAFLQNFLSADDGIHNTSPWHKYRTHADYEAARFREILEEIKKAEDRLVQQGPQTAATEAAMRDLKQHVIDEISKLEAKAEGQMKEGYWKHVNTTTKQQTRKMDMGYRMLDVLLERVWAETGDEESCIDAECKAIDELI